MRLIDADKLRKDVIDLPNTYNGFSDTYDKAMIVDLVDEQPTVDAEPTEEQVKEYCRKRCLAVVDSALFNEMKARWTVNYCVNCLSYDYCSARRMCINPPYGYCTRYQPKRCGAKMDKNWEEPEINPCRGCTDYDGHGGCKSNGGCGAERREDETY